MYNDSSTVNVSRVEDVHVPREERRGDDTKFERDEDVLLEGNGG